MCHHHLSRASGFGRAGSGRWLVALAAVLAVAGDGLGQPPAAKGRADADGLPLPDGAVARLGSARFRFAG